MVHNWAVLLIAWVVAISITLPIGAVILQLSCTLYNLFAGVSGARATAAGAWVRGHALKSEADQAQYDRIATFPGVPKPSFDRAVRIVFLATLINVPATFIIFQLLRMAVRENLASYRDLVPTVCLALPMGILVLAGLNTARMPTTFGKGLLVSLLSHLFAAILASVIVLIVLAFG